MSKKPRERDSMTVIIVNRDMYSGHSVSANINGFAVADGSYRTLQLSSLPAEETFKSHTDNALTSGSVDLAANSFDITVPSLSTTAVLLKGSASGIIYSRELTGGIKIYPNPATNDLFVSLSSHIAEPTRISVTDASGRQIMTDIVNFDGHSPLHLDISSIQEGYYILSAENRHCSSTGNFAVIR